MKFACLRRFVSRASLSLIACLWVSAQAIGRDLIEIKTPYFTVLSALSEGQTLELVEKMRAFQSKVLSLTPIKNLRPQVPLRIYLIESRDWREIAPSQIAEGVMYQRPLGFTAVMNAQSWADETVLLFHEYTHFILGHGATRDYPRWYEEGFADFMSTFEVARGKTKVGMPSVNRLHSLAMFGAASWLPLRKVLATESSLISNDGGRSHSEELGFYAESWALVHYLVFEAADGYKGLQEYLDLRAKNLPIDEAFARAFHMSVAEMEGKLRKYVQRKRFRYLNGEVDAATLPSYGELKARQLSSTESALELSKVVARVKSSSLLSYAEKLVKADPANLVALAGKANALAIEKRFAEGRELLERVLASKTTDPEILLMAGDTYDIEAKLEEGATDEERAQLRRTMFGFYHEALREPYVGFEDLEIIVRYAARALEYGTSYERALMQIEQVRKIYPAEPVSAMIHARLLQALNRSAEAREPWSVAAEYSWGMDQIAALEELEKLDDRKRAK